MQRDERTEDGRVAAGSGAAKDGSRMTINFALANNAS